jgi:hypothetical protein
MSLKRPNAVITLSGQKYSAAEAALIRLRVALSVRGCHDSVALEVWPSSKLAKADTGAKMSVALGPRDNEADIWSGDISEVQASADALMIIGLALTAGLSHTRVSQTYLDQSVGDIVRSLAAGIAIDDVASDLSLQAYAVDDRRSVWSHLLDLAAIAGAEVGASASGALRFVPVRKGNSNLTLRHGADIIAWQVAAQSAPDTPTVAAYGAASEAGADQWDWIVSSPAPQGSGPVMRVVPAIRTRDGAGVMARALAARAARAATYGRLGLVGRANVRPGDLVDVTDLPGKPPGTLRVLEVNHLLDPERGFLTALTVQGAGQ